MVRPVILLAFFFISLSLFSQMLGVTGVAADLGLNERVGGDSEVNAAEDTAKEVDTGAPTGETLFGAYNVLTDQLATIFGVINPGLRMLYNAGVPAFIVGGPSTIGLLPPLATIVQAVGITLIFRGI